MFYEDYIDNIIKEETERLLEYTYNINGFQDSQWGASANTAQQQQTQPQQQGQQQQGQSDQQQPSQENGDGKKQGFFKRAWNWGKEKLQNAANGANQSINRASDKQMSPNTGEGEQDIIADLVKNKCMDAATAKELHAALFGKESDFSYIDQASSESSKEGEEGTQSQGQQGEEGSMAPSFAEGDDGEGFSNEMVQNMQGKLSQDGSNPYANISVNIIEQ